MFFPRPSDVGCLLHGGLQILAGPLRVGSPDVAPFGGPAGLDLHDRRPLHWAFDTCVQLALHSKQISGACFDNTLPNKTCLLNGVPPSYEYKLFLQIYLVRRTLVCIHSCAGHTCSLHKTQTHLHASTPSLTPHGLHLPFALAPLQLPQRGRASPPSSMAHRSGSSVAPLTPLLPSKFFGDPRTFAKEGEAKTEFAILRLYRCHVVFASRALRGLRCSGCEVSVLAQVGADGRGVFSRFNDKVRGEPGLTGRGKFTIIPVPLRLMFPCVLD